MDFELLNEFDVQLTPLGVEQAATAGKFLKEYFEGNGYHFDKIIMEVSPFLRCMMTAGQIAKELGVTDITINYLAAEYLNVVYLKHDPMPNIEWTKSGFNFENM